MKVGYTEFSFGYAFTENLLRSVATRSTGAPHFPNLIQEAQLGYDVRIDFPGCPLFFQYKLPELMVRNTAAEIAQHALAGLSVPFFRMSLMRRDLSQQHQLLINWEHKFPNTVYYATPSFQNIGSFNAAYNVAQVHQQSVFFSPANIGPLQDNKQHVVEYRSGLGYAWVCSEPREISALTFERIEETVKRLFNEPAFRTLKVAAKNMKQEIFSLVSPQLRDSEGAIRQRIRARRVILPDRPEISSQTREVAEELLVSREIARAGLGLDMIIAQPRP